MRSESEEFSFYLKNPHGFPARKFGLTSNSAVSYEPRWGPFFCDIGVSDHCNTHRDNFSSLGEAYANDTDLDGDVVLTGSNHFRVKEIEVFEITDSTTLPNPARLPRKSRFAPNQKKVKSSRVKSKYVKLSQIQSDLVQDNTINSSSH
jgi:hypothetical protein